jgi:PAS domain S-box-containing protein
VRRTALKRGGRPADSRRSRLREGSALHPFLLVPLLSGVAAVALGTAILGRDARDPAHRLTAAMLFCAAYWSFLELIWNSQAEPTWVPTLVRLSSLGWMPLGVLSLHLFAELGTDRGWLRRALPVLYGLTAADILVYVVFPGGIAGAVRTSFGWSFRYGSLFLLQYVPVALLATISLTVLSRRLVPPGAPASERRQARWVSLAIGVPLVTASATDAILPWLGVHVPRLGSASITLIGAVIAWSTRRYGYSVVAPGTYAPQILASLRDGVALLRPDGAIRRANRALARLCECQEAQLVGRPIADFLPDLPRLESRDLSGFECQLVSESGRRVEVSLSSSALLDRVGDRAGWVLSVRDIREVVALRSQLMLSGRLSAVGELAAGIAHEINNPVAYVQSNLNQLGAHWREVRKRLVEHHDDHSLESLLADGDELVHESLAGVRRVAAIVQEVRSFAQADRGERSPADLNELLESAVRVAEPKLRYRAVVERDYGELPPVSCNAQELRQVFLDLLLNAAKAIADGGTVHLQTRREGGHAAVRIEDDGCGMAPEVRARIFDPFFTTARDGQGLGLGLSLSYQIVRRHGGEIEVDSEPGRGTRFRIRLPIEP